jgi:hypothetical protein
MLSVSSKLYMLRHHIDTNVLLAKEVHNGVA